ncbi:MAG: hypothetical protein J6M38_09935, partial [Lentisphaeria bacterium]|nr:hypothetical protein [Lentisphaeria bacterium]
SENYTVKFSAVVEEEDPVALFSLIFGGDDGEQLGVIKTSQNEYVTVNLVMEDLGDNVHSDDIMSILCEMQEAVNVLIPQFTLE